MAKVKGEVDISQDDKITLDAFLKDVNAARREEELSEFATIDAYASFVLDSALGSYIRGKHADDKEEVGELYDAADQTDRAAVDAILGRLSRV